MGADTPYSSSQSYAEVSLVSEHRYRATDPGDSSEATAARRDEAGLVHAGRVQRVRALNGAPERFWVVHGTLIW